MISVTREDGALMAGESAHPAGLVDTSVLISWEQGRPSLESLPALLTTSAITVGELRAGVLAAPDSPTRIMRLRILRRAETLSPLPVDDDVADAWAALRVMLSESGRRMAINDSWIAATAIAHQLPLVTHDLDFDGVPGLDVVRV
ncbi:MAG TPA: PIN domain-containing protein [Acidimicrobiales bacterium]|nr:PIN domain-containing protein [Acidimicrobiales bacterium]